MKSNDYGAVRAGKGLYLSTYPTSPKQPLDVRDASSQLVNAESVIEAMSELSVAHEAESLQAGHESLKGFNDATRHALAGAAVSRGGRTAGGGTGQANGFSKPIMLAASPAGIAMSTQDSAHLSAEGNINLISGQSTHMAVGKSLIAGVAEKLSFFAQNAGMKLFAGKGKVEIQAHSDNIELIAQKTLKAASSTEAIHVIAKEEIVLTSGGAYIRLKGGNIEIHAPGEVDVKGAQHLFGGPASMNPPLPVLPVVQHNLGDQHFVLKSHDGAPVANQRYRMTAGEKIVEGRTDASGKTQIMEGEIGHDVHFELLDDYNEHFILRDPLGEPIANMRYRIRSESGKVVGGVTDGEGKTVLFASEKIERVELLHTPSDEPYPPDNGVN